MLIGKRSAVCCLVSSNVFKLTCCTTIYTNLVMFGRDFIIIGVGVMASLIFFAKKDSIVGKKLKKKEVSTLTIFE